MRYIVEYYIAIGIIGLICISVYCFRIKIGFIDRSGGLDRNTTLALKGIAIVTIITHHLVQNMSKPGILLPYRGFGYLATGIFFFLSGYGLSEQYIKIEEMHKDYWKKRIISVYLPLIITMVSFHMVFCWLKGSWQAFWTDITSGIFGHWYIQMLSVWYVLFFVIIIVFHDNRKRVICFWTSAVIIYGICMWLVVFKTYYDTIWCFPLGVCLSVCYSSFYKILNKYWKIISCLSFVMMAVFACYSFQKTDFIAVLVRSLSSVLLLVWLMSILMCVEFKNNSIAKFWGTISYAVFLCHVYFLRDVHSIKTVVFYYGICIILGYVYTKIYQRLKKGLSK